MRRKKKRHLEETSYWLSYSDMMAALLLIFVLIISFTMLQSQRRYEQKQEELKQQQALVQSQQEQLQEQQEQLDKLIGIRTELIDGNQSAAFAQNRLFSAKLREGLKFSR